MLIMGGVIGIMISFFPDGFLLLGLNNCISILGFKLVTDNNNPTLDGPFPCEFIFNAFLGPIATLGFTSLIVALLLHFEAEIGPPPMLRNPIIRKLSVGLPVSVENIGINRSFIGDR